MLSLRGRSDRVALSIAEELATLGPIPWQCWDVPGFKACHTEAGHQTHRDLLEIGADPANEVVWAQMYELRLRQNLKRCEVLSNCSSGSIAARTPTPTTGAESDILARLRATTPQEKPSVFPKLLAVGVVAALLFYAIKRMKT